MTQEPPRDDDAEPGTPAEPAPYAPPPGDDLDGYLTPTRRLVRASLPVIGVIVAIAMVLPLGWGLIEAWVFDRAGDRVAAEVTDELDAALARSVVLVRTTTCLGGSGSGTAFVGEIDGATVLLTNRHVVEDAASVGIRPLDGGALPRVTGWRLSRSADVAVLLVDDPAALPAPLPVLDGTVDVGASLRTVGFPRAFPFTSAGEVVDANRGTLLVDVRTEPGASGSPLLDANGRVAGQIHSRTTEGLGVATSGAGLTAAVDDAGATRSGC